MQAADLCPALESGGRKGPLESPRHTHIKGFTYSTHWAEGFKLHPYANGLRAVGVRRGQGANSECLCMGDDKKYSVTSDLQKKKFCPCPFRSQIPTIKLLLYSEPVTEERLAFFFFFLLPQVSFQRE